MFHFGGCWKDSHESEINICTKKDLVEIFNTIFSVKNQMVNTRL